MMSLYSPGCAEADMGEANGAPDRQIPGYCEILPSEEGAKTRKGEQPVEDSSSDGGNVDIC